MHAHLHAVILQMPFDINNVIICFSAGVGRTGCYILIDAMLERIDNGEGSLDIFNYLQYMRTRRINMVQTLVRHMPDKTILI